MQKEPEIVKILREEERLRTLQTKSCSSNETVQKSEDDSIHETDDSIMLVYRPSTIIRIPCTRSNSNHLRTAFEHCPCCYSRS